MSEPIMVITISSLLEIFIFLFLFLSLSLISSSLTIKGCSYGWYRFWFHYAWLERRLCSVPCSRFFLLSPHFLHLRSFMCVFLSPLAGVYYQQVSQFLASFMQINFHFEVFAFPQMERNHLNLPCLPLCLLHHLAPRRPRQCAVFFIHQRLQRERNPLLFGNIGTWMDFE